MCTNVENGHGKYKGSRQVREGNKKYQNWCERFPKSQSQGTFIGLYAYQFVVHGLNAGKNVLRLEMTFADTGRVNIDYVEISSKTAAPIAAASVTVLQLCRLP